MSHSFSRTWKSDDHKDQEKREQEARRIWTSDRHRELDRFRRVLPQLRRMYRDGIAPVPWNFEDWLHFRSATVRAEHEALMRRVDARQQERVGMAVLMTETGKTHLRLFDGGTVRPTGQEPWPNVSAVLAAKTIWCEDGERDRHGAQVWPDYSELKFEGEDRLNSKQWSDYRRMVPLPRFKHPWNEAAAWSLRPRLMQHEFDEPYRIKTYEDIYFPVEPVDDLQGRLLIGGELIEAIDIAGEKI